MAKVHLILGKNKTGCGRTIKDINKSPKATIEPCEVTCNQCMTPEHQAYWKKQGKRYK